MATYQTERLILTSMRPEHTAELFQLHADPVVQKIIYDNTPQTIEDVLNWIERSLAQWRKNGFGTWIVYEKCVDSPVFIGRCGLRDYADTNNIELSISLLQRGVGRGLGLEAARFAITHALRGSTKEKVVGLIRHCNLRSQRAATKLGLRYIDDRWHDGRFYQYYEMTREEYFSQPRDGVSR
ncbi:putative Acetyltransferase including N-acetylase of ribosomal protein [Mesorhizobium sp. ORS 3359]|uniref:GNAT family N-acetyltransferase n=1 Tax=Mesorhizobium sp. LCM 4576 TaxID=1848289 RepID=UPI0005085E8E|nr:GNAT family N-acetyltransferase [Mesorhizobium sp. LCM 4576]OHV69775.1 hypothetical protein LCM4576_22360 [Mesorhizobium sp. LCM 4576]CDX45379.1 putative Acetyltransferase including N-acetylase of ribosomal protein [Mesorhizobium sp. ORS 3359]